jgi:hypothetical protein
MSAAGKPRKCQKSYLGEAANATGYAEKPCAEQKEAAGFRAKGNG